MILILFATLLIAFEKLDWRFIVKAPYYFPKVGDIPFWQANVAQHSPTVLRLANSLVGSKGKIASDKLPYINWRIKSTFKISGDYYGSNGFGIFFVEDPKFTTSSVLGVAPDLKGVGLVFTSSGQSGLRQNVALVALDGKQTISRLDDFSKFRKEGCFSDYRNSFTDYTVNIIYKDGTIKASVGEKETPVDCFEYKIDIPKNYHILISAESGQNPDAHDMLNFELYDLDAKEKQKAQPDNKSDLEKLEKMEHKMDENIHKNEWHQPPINHQEVSSVKTELAAISKKLDAMDAKQLELVVAKLQKSVKDLESSGSTNIGQALSKLQDIQVEFKNEIEELKNLIMRLQVILI